MFSSGPISDLMDVFFSLYTHDMKNKMAVLAVGLLLMPFVANGQSLDAGVPEARIAKALNRSVHTVRHHRSILQHLCPRMHWRLLCLAMRDSIARIRVSCGLG